MKKDLKNKNLEFEEIFADKIGSEENIVEISLEKNAFRGIGIFLIIGVLVVVAQIFSLTLVRGQAYQTASLDNQDQKIYSSAPRGIIYDRFGVPLVENKMISSVYLDLNEYAQHPEEESEIENVLSGILGVNPQDFLNAVNKMDYKHTSQMILANNLTLDQVVAIKSANLKSLVVQDDYNRIYADGPVFSSVVGYVGLPTANDLKNSSGNFVGMIGRSGLEAYYNSQLSGMPGITTNFKNAQGALLYSKETRPVANGDDLHLSIDYQFQNYFYQRLQERLNQLGLDAGVGIAMNPQNGEILALFNIPSFDNNVLVSPGLNKEKSAILSSPLEPLFNRAISGLYSPGSTIKPLEAVALLKEGAVNTTTQVFSPGYLDIPNPYNPNQFSRYMDWRYQGWVDMYHAIAWSSDVYFYATIGGLPQGQSSVMVQGGQINPLGIAKLMEWWQKFKLGDLTGIDLPGEAQSFLPSPDWMASKDKKPWLLGDTYNVGIGQGDLLLTPIRLLDYIGAIANGGKIYQPFIDMDYNQPRVEADLTDLAPEISEVQKGMRESVTDPRGTAYTLNDLPFTIGAKTGSAQIDNNAKENAFFVGYAPFNNPQIAILILIENSKEGSLNTVPVAKDVLNWYYENRLKK
ncbi:MAG: penicillin-binding transpeptidase domain-containing protein [Patescibacteria group bacterium]|nr:penicillin-binding transpeptidase domain-containing protein [Patescibacteria group bacterium]